jgi:hypothetical protein
MQALYYAHAMCIYGTFAERFELKRIRSGFRRVRIVNPAKYDGHPEKLEDTIGFCLRLVEKCDAVVFSRLLGKVTAGVGKEVNHALRLGRPVFELVGGQLKRRKNRVKYVSRAATIRLYERWRRSLWMSIYGN